MVNRQLEMEVGEGEERVEKGKRRAGRGIEKQTGGEEI